MKTKEEILKEEWQKVTVMPFDEITKHHLRYALEAMQLYSDQQNKEMLEFCEDRIDVLQTVCNQYKAEITSLRELLGRAKKHVNPITAHLHTDTALSFLTEIDNALNHKT